MIKNKSFILVVVFLLSACQGENKIDSSSRLGEAQDSGQIENLESEARSTEYSTVVESGKKLIKSDLYPNYKLMGQYLKILTDIFKTNGFEESLVEIKNKEKSYFSQIQKKCKKNDHHCIEMMSLKFNHEIVNNYFDVKSLFRGELVPVSKDNECYENKAVINIDAGLRKVFVINNCGPEKITFYISYLDIPESISPESYMTTLGASVEPGGEINQEFTFLPAGEHRWVVLTNGERSVRGFMLPDNAAEIPLASIYRVLK